MDDAAAAGHDIAVSPISLAEIVYLVEKNRLPASAYDELRNALANPDYVIEEAPFNVELVDAKRQVPRADVPDMPDRIVAATALYFGAAVISRDARFARPIYELCGEACRRRCNTVVRLWLG